MYSLVVANSNLSTNTAAVIGDAGKVDEASLFGDVNIRVVKQTRFKDGFPLVSSLCFSTMVLINVTSLEITNLCQLRTKHL